MVLSLLASIDGVHVFHECFSLGGILWLSLLFRLDGADWNAVPLVRCIWYVRLRGPGDIFCCGTRWGHSGMVITILLSLTTYR